jgi:hypothetical protein
MMHQGDYELRISEVKTNILVKSDAHVGLQVTGFQKVCYLYHSIILENIAQYWKESHAWRLVEYDS